MPVGSLLKFAAASEDGDDDGEDGDEPKLWTRVGNGEATKAAAFPIWSPSSSKILVAFESVKLIFLLLYLWAKRRLTKPKDCSRGWCWLMS